MQQRNKRQFLLYFNAIYNNEEIVVYLTEQRTKKKTNSLRIEVQSVQFKNWISERKSRQNDEDREINHWTS